MFLSSFFGFVSDFSFVSDFGFLLSSFGYFRFFILRFFFLHFVSIYFSDFSDFDQLFSNSLFSDFLIFDYLLSPFVYFIHSVSLLYYFNIVLFYLFLLDYQNVCFYIHLIPFTCSFSFVISIF